ncbi:putative lipoprotein [Brevundimonas bullata]|uniref:Putative lipoprotein n=1 Tax=Brevundimonas bullata TaxID=13160 RepID=A0A7W7IM38_9CAUL|nr:hypothetical protein [Brevundimonas bullata]MBB4796440.1 putative lipoprotein [Brevundimonas bullata]MBB6381400.1 putative lipoprotein [Brevundimonas bullata]
MKKAATASIMALAVVMGLAACNREPAPVAAETPAEAWVGKDVVLYLPDPVMKARVEVAALSPYVNAAAIAAEGAIRAAPAQAGASGMLLLMVKPGGRSKAWVVTGEPAASAETVAAVVKAVEAVPAPAVREGPILVGVGFEAWGGGAPPAGANPPIPRDWYSYFPKDGGRLDDAFMARVWPD